MPCSICGSQLLVGKENDNSTLWCPKCEKIEIIPKKDVLKLIGEDMQKFAIERDAIFKKFSKNSILGSLCATLESVSALSRIYVMRSDIICYTSFAIRDVEKLYNFGLEEVDPESLDFQRLLQIYDELFIDRFILQSLIQDGYAVGIAIPPNAIKNFSAVPLYYFDNIKLDYKKNKICYIKFTEEWQFNKLVASRFGILTEVDARHGFKGPNLGFRKRESIIEKLDLLKQAFKFSVGTSNLISDLKKNLDLIKPILKLYKDYEKNFTPGQQSFEIAYGSLSPVTKEEILISLSKIYSKPEELYKRLLKIKMPILVEFDSVVLFLPNTSLVYLNLLRSEKSESKINEYRNMRGKFFEELVYMALFTFKYKIKNPNTQEPLLSFHINDGNVKKEIDAAGYKDDLSVIVECKHFEIGSDFFRRKIIERRKKKLKKELERFSDRLEVLKRDSNYQFLTKDKKIFAYFVTLHPEPISNLDNIKVVDYRDFIKELGDLSPPIDEKFEIELEKILNITTRIYGKTMLIGIDYTKSIKNPFGIKSFVIPSPDVNKSSIHIGDGKVLNQNNNELTIETIEGFILIIDLIKEDVEYLNEQNIKNGDGVRFQIYTRDPLYTSYYLRFISKI